MYFFGDNHETSVGKPEPEIFCYGGYLISKENLKPLEECYYQIKDNYQIPHHLPPKWNLKDKSLSKFYEEYNSVKLLEKIMYSEKRDIRKDILKCLSDYQIKILFSGFRELRTKTQKAELLEWSFTNILQRLSYEKRDENCINIILDRDKESYKLFCETYMYPIYFQKGIQGEYFHCKKICKNIPFITYSVTIFNPFLQIADIIIGACGSFLKYALKDKEKQNAFKYFKIIIPLIRGFESTNIDQLFQRGLMIKPLEDEELVKDKIIEII
jgi:hypothetical protein